MVTDMYKQQMEATAFSDRFKKFLARICDTCLVLYDEEKRNSANDNKVYKMGEPFETEDGRWGYWRSGIATHKKWVKHVENHHQRWLRSFI